jgi:hypothetical protein
LVKILPVSPGTWKPTVDRGDVRRKRLAMSPGVFWLLLENTRWGELERDEAGGHTDGK